MKKRLILLIGLALILLMSGCQGKSALPEQGVTSGAETDLTDISTTGPVEITGSFTYSNDFVVETYMVEQAVALADMTGFIRRDREYLTTTESQTLGYMQPDYENNAATFWIQLPLQPRGELNIVDPTGESNQGVQVFSVAYWPNLAGGPYSEGDDPSYGWPTYLASVHTDTENKDEVTGGKLIIWSPDDKQNFPSGFGADAMLFTADDPVAPVSAGYTVVDLDASPFKFSREAKPEFILYEPTDVAIKDFSGDSYTVSFQKMFDILKKEYAFNGIEGKSPDWDALYADLMPKVQAAEDSKDATAFYLAIRDFTWAFHDGHVGLSGGDLENQIYQDAVNSGYGFAIRRLDGGSVITTFVTQGGPADQAGVKPGDVLVSMNGIPVQKSLAAVKPLSAPFSTDFALEYQQSRYLLRALQGTQAEFKFVTSTGKERTISITAVPEWDSYSVTSIYNGSDPNALPVEYRILDSGVGYIKINSNYDDLNLIIRLFTRALKTFEANEVIGVIIDLRQNGGGSPLGLAGYLYNKEIPLGQLEYYSDKSGKFEPEGTAEKVLPSQEQYQFDKMAVLVGQACASACEIEAYGFSQVPGMMVFGETPSAGVEAEVGRGQFSLPDGISLQAPTGRFTLPDGSIFLEGQGVQLTNPVPVNAVNVLSGGDYILEAAVNAILKPEGAGLVPSGNPIVTSAEEARSFLYSGEALILEDLAQETYDDLSIPGETYTYTVPMKESQQILWGYFWCAANQAVLEQNFQNIKLDFTLNGIKQTPDNLFSEDFPNQGQACRVIAYNLDQWPAGEHHLQLQVTFKSKINDGMGEYPKGVFTYHYAVYVKP